MLRTRIEDAASKVKRRRRRGLGQDWRKFGEKWRGSKAAALGANLIGAIGCILGNKHVMTHGARAPLFLTFMGYLLIVLYHQLERRRNIGVAPVFDVEGAQLPPYRPPKKVVVALVLLTATAPSLANASLMFNSVGFTQLSKVLTTPSIAFIERARGHGHPLDTGRIICLLFIHIGVYVASVADVTLNRTGCLVALANVCVTARYKTAWSSASRAAIARRRATRGAHEAAATLGLDERAAVRELVEHTLPYAAAALVPWIFVFEREALKHMVGTFDAAAYGRLFGVAVLGAWTSATGYMVIGRLSALTHQVLGQFKMACLLLGSYVLLGADLNRQQFGGASLTMASIVLYTRCTLTQRRRLAKRDDEPSSSGAADPLLSPGRRRRVSSPTNGHARRMPGVLSSRGVKVV